MGKRLLDHSDPVAMSAEKMPKKNERSHEENQERAYIAASRRSDRSIEARLQSARMASEIHRKRTGKGFKITEEIVRKEEMYEEEDDDIPRQYRALTAHLHTSSPSMNHRANAYVTSQIAAAAFARELEINRQFAEQFPYLPPLSRPLAAQGMYGQSLHQEPSPGMNPYQQGHHIASPPPMEYHPRHRSQSAAQITPQPHSQTGFSPFDHQSPIPRHASFDDPVPALTPSSGRTQTPSSSGTPPLFPNDEFQFRGPSTPGLPVDPLLGIPATNTPFSFTSGIPNNTKGMMKFDATDATSFFTMPDGGELAGSVEWPGGFSPRDISLSSSEQKSLCASILEPSESVDTIHLTTADSFSRQHGSRISSPSYGGNVDWNTWINASDDGSVGEPEMI